MTDALYVIAQVYLGLTILMRIAVLGLAVFAAVTVSTTRDDAFTVIDRQKQNWLLLCIGAAFAALVSILAPGLMLLWIIAAVIVGVYWQDVRPAIREVLDNASGSW